MEEIIIILNIPTQIQLVIRKCNQELLNLYQNKEL